MTRKMTLVLPWRRLALGLFLIPILALSTAHAETFDLVSFQPPPGKRSAAADAVSFTDATPTTFAVYGVYKSAPGSGDPARDFAAEWEMLVARSLRVDGELKTETVDWPGGWKMTMGSAKVWSEQARSFVALLSVFTGHGVKVSVLVHYNDDRYLPKINRFLASVRLAAPAVAAAPTASAPAARDGGASAAPALTAQEWYTSAANYPMWGFFRNAPTAGAFGSANWSYRFAADGTYAFAHEFWSLQRPDEVWYVEESGVYRQTADRLTLEPRQVQRVLRDKQGQTRGTPQALPKEPATYRYAFQYLEGMQAWYLVLMPEGGRETHRDGTLNDIPGYGRAYRYGPRPYCEQRPRPADCKGEDR